MDYGLNSQEQLRSNDQASSLSKMSEDSYLPPPIAIWNSVRGVWEKDEPNLLCEHLGLFSEVWPTSGMMLDGRVYVLPTLEPLMDGSGFSSQPQDVANLPTPTVGHIRNHDEDLDKFAEREGKGLSGEYRGRIGKSLGVAVRLEMLPTPNTMDSLPARSPEKIAESKERTPAGYSNLRETVVNEIDNDALLRTPSVVDSTGGAISETQARERGRMVKVADQAAELAFENGLKVSDSIAQSLAKDDE